MNRVCRQVCRIWDFTTGLRLGRRLLEEGGRLRTSPQSPWLRQTPSRGKLSQPKIQKWAWIPEIPHTLAWLGGRC